MSNRDLKPDNSPAVPVSYVASGVALIAAGAGAYWFSLGPSAGTSAPTVKTAPPLSLPPPGIPVYSGMKALAGTLGDPSANPVAFQQGQTFSDAPAPYFLEMWTVRWVADQGVWGEWDGPTQFRGHVTRQGSILRAELWSSPEDDLVTFLNALTATNATAGFWIARSVPVLQEQDPKGGVFTKADHTPTQIGTPGPWISGRFGSIQDLNATLDAATKQVLGLFGATSGTANVTVYELAPVGGLPVPIEVKLA